MVARAKTPSAAQSSSKKMKAFWISVFERKDLEPHEAVIFLRPARRMTVQNRRAVFSNVKDLLTKIASNSRGPVLRSLSSFALEQPSPSCCGRSTYMNLSGCHECCRAKKQLKKNSEPATQSYKTRLLRRSVQSYGKISRFAAIVRSEYFGHAICVEFLLGYFPSPTRINSAQNKG
jgi:hypothetical protein